MWKIVSKVNRSEKTRARGKRCLSKLQLAFDALVEKHKNYSQLLEDDSKFDAEGGWMGECQENFMLMERGAKMYLDSFLSKAKTPLKTYDTKAKNKSDAGQGSGGVPSTQIDVDTPSISSGDNNHPINSDAQQSTSSGNDNDLPNHESGPFVAIHGVNDNIQTSSNASTGTCGFKMEKPKMPKFAGDVRNYVIFRADYKHAIELKYSKEDAITFLCTCLQDKPLE